MSALMFYIIGCSGHNCSAHPASGNRWKMYCALARRTALHFVRCIKPNNEQAQDDYDAALVLHQLRCCGITEVTRIARAGYPTRYGHAQFAHRYSSLLGNAAPRARASHLTPQ